MTAPTQPYRVVLDTDLAMGAPGSDIDDGFALALALADPEINLLAVTTVAGNTDVDTATVLGLELLHRLGAAAIEVHRGAAGPWRGPARRQGSVPADVPRRDPHGTDAAALIADTVLAHPGEVTVVAVGPLTNVARALQSSPQVGPAMRGLMIMGGRFVPEDPAAPSAEFNISCDPEAAAVVAASSVRQWWVGLDVTLQCRVDLAWADALAAGDDFAAFAGVHTRRWIEHLAEQRPGLDWCAMHDPLAVAALTRRELVDWQPGRVEVLTDDEPRGVTVAHADPSGPARIAVGVRPADFADRFAELLGR